MKIIAGIFFFIFSFLQIVKSQKFDKPESITFDKKTSEYFVSNVGSGEILKIDTKGNIQNFISGYVSFLGIKLHKGVIYCVENQKYADDIVLGFNKKNKKLVFSLSIPNTKQLNDLEFDDKGNLYVTDRIGNKIYKISIKNKSCEVIDNTINTPNGLYFDKNNNRMLICNTIDSCSIYQYDLKTEKISIVVNTNYAHLDGITMDNRGIIYFTSWSKDWKTSILFKYADNRFTELLINNNGMADIEYNSKTNEIDIANYFGNSVTHYKINND